MTENAHSKVETLYRIYDATDSLIYVGITCRGVGRLKEHNKDKPWWVESAKVTVEHFDTRAEAERAEKRAIVGESPKYNIAHTQNTPAPSAATGGRNVSTWGVEYTYEAPPRYNSYGNRFFIVTLKCGGQVALQAEDYSIESGALVFSNAFRAPVDAEPRESGSCAAFGPGEWARVYAASQITGDPVAYEWARGVDV